MENIKMIFVPRPLLEKALDQLKRAQSDVFVKDTQVVIDGLEKVLLTQLIVSAPMSSNPHPMEKNIDIPDWRKKGICDCTFPMYGQYHGYCHNCMRELPSYSAPPVHECKVCGKSFVSHNDLFAHYDETHNRLY